MGLDVSAYRNAVLVEVLPRVEDWEEKYYDLSQPLEWRPDTDYIHNIRGFESRRGNLVTGGVYRHTERFDFRAGSYSGYNWWRDQLSRCMLGVSAKEAWSYSDNPTWQEKSFFSLIHFSDCEGVIGTEICKRLAKDFADNQAAADAYNAEDDSEWWHEQYSKWRKAFELAADNGYVDFH